MGRREYADLLTVREVAELLSVTTWTVKQWSRKGILAAKKLEGTRKLYFDKQEIMDRLQPTSEVTADV